jgi:hypothetical protein
MNGVRMRPIVVASKLARLTFLLLLLAASVSTLTNHRRALYCPAPEVASVYSDSIAQLDAMGRLPLSGELSGELNNAYQIARHPADPAKLGCGDQAAFVYARLSQLPGWKFKMEYVYGLSSPILLPHQFITGRGPHGEIATIDPWADRIEVRL